MMTTRDMNSGRMTTSVSRGNTFETDTDKPTTTALKPSRTTTTGAAAAAAAAEKTMTTITSDPGILCFHHCNVKVFCFTLPHICPLCKAALATPPSGGANSAAGIGGSGNRVKNINTIKLNNKKIKNNNNNNKNADQSLAMDCHKDDNDVGKNEIGNRNHSNNAAPANATYNSDDDDDNDDNGDADNDDNDLNRNNFTSNIMASRLLPFRLPYPFVRANQYPCAIVLRPTTGDFLNDYNNTTDLHIAVTTSTGCVVEFDRHGLRRHRTDNMTEWWQCLLVGDVPEPWYDYWDQVLFEICQQPDKWTVLHYHEDKHNCYTFVLNFLQALTYGKLSEAATSKTRFCEKYIVPRTTTAGKYISLYRKLRDAGIYVHHTNHNKVRYAKQEMSQQQQHCNPNKSNNITTVTMAKNILVTNNQQQEHLSNQQHHHHHNHHSIISRPPSTLCTIEE